MEYGTYQTTWTSSDILFSKFLGLHYMMFCMYDRDAGQPHLHTKTCQQHNTEYGKLRR